MKRILVVDDEPALLKILKEHFQGQYEVDTANSGAAAIERFVRQRPDVVFLDVNMPGISGWRSSSSSSRATTASRSSW